MVTYFRSECDYTIPLKAELTQKVQKTDMRITTNHCQIFPFLFMYKNLHKMAQYQHDNELTDLALSVLTSSAPVCLYCVLSFTVNSHTNKFNCTKTLFS